MSGPSSDLTDILTRGRWHKTSSCGGCILCLCCPVAVLNRVALSHVSKYHISFQLPVLRSQRCETSYEMIAGSRKLVSFFFLSRQMSLILPKKGL